MDRKLIIKSVIFISGIVIIVLLFSAFIYYKQVTRDIGLALMILSVVILAYFLFFHKQGLPETLAKKPQLPLDDVKEEIKNRAGKYYGLKSIYIPPQRVGKVKIPARYEVPDLEFTGNDRIYNFRGDWIAQIEAHIKTGPMKGLKMFVINLSQDMKLIKSGNFTMQEGNIWSFNLDHRKYPPAPAVSRLSQELSEIMPFVKGDVSRAIEIARGNPIPVFAGEYYGGERYRSPPSSRSKRSYRGRSRSPSPPSPEEFGE